MNYNIKRNTEGPFLEGASELDLVKAIALPNGFTIIPTTPATLHADPCWDLYAPSGRWFAFAHDEKERDEKIAREQRECLFHYPGGNRRK